jgi:type I restriction enzyme, S subunit
MTNKQKLPSNWIDTTIDNIFTKPQYGYTTKASDTGTIKLLRTTDITSGKINCNTVPFCLIKPDKSEKYYLDDGDIDISRAGSVGFSYLIIKPIKAVLQLT